VFRSESTVLCRISLRSVGSGTPGLNSRAIRLVPFGGSFVLICICTPRASCMDPASSLNFATSISENDSISTKKHRSSTDRSANVTIHGGTLDVWAACVSSSRAIDVTGDGSRRLALVFGAAGLRQVVLEDVLHD